MRVLSASRWREGFWLSGKTSTSTTSTATTTTITAVGVVVRVGGHDNCAIDIELDGAGVWLRVCSHCRQ